MREKWIDNAKGIAILMVILGHVSGGLEGFWNFKFVYGVHLVLFFVLSGYTLRRQAVTADYLRTKFSRLMRPYFLTCLAVMLMDVFNAFLWDDRSILSITQVIGADLARSFFASGTIHTFGPVDIGTHIGAIWFLPAMFFALVFLQLLLQAFDGREGPVGAFSAAVALLGYVSARFVWLPFSIQSAMVAVFFLWLGYEIRQRDLLSRLRPHHYVIAQILLVAGIYAGFCSVQFVTADLNDLVLSVIVGLAGCLLIYLLSRLDRGVILAWIGQNSLRILCTHLFALNTLARECYLLVDAFHLEGNARVWAVIALEILFAVGAAWLLNVLEARLADRRSAALKRQDALGRDAMVDVARGILIVAMLIGHFRLDGRVWGVIYSCHMVAFVFFSGYFFNAARPAAQTLRRMAKSFLLPYAVFALGTVLLGFRSWSRAWLKSTAVSCALGMSFSDRILQNVGSVGPVWFVLLLLTVRLIYLPIGKCIRSESAKWAAVLSLSLLGCYLGKLGWWLPWSADIALYSLVFYHLGAVMRQHGAVEYVRAHPPVYFLLSPVLAYLVYTGSPELAARHYGQYGLGVLGALAGILLLILLADAIKNRYPLACGVFRTLGECSIYILVLHTLLRAQIRALIGRFFAPDYITNMTLCILVQLMLSVAVWYAVRFLKRRRTDRAQ